MKPPPIPDYSLHKIESMARSLLRERWPTLAVPVDIDYLLETEPGVNMDTDPIPNCAREQKVSERS